MALAPVVMPFAEHASAITIKPFEIFSLKLASRCASELSPHKRRNVGELLVEAQYWHGQLDLQHRRRQEAAASGPLACLGHCRIGEEDFIIFAGHWEQHRTQDIMGRSLPPPQPPPPELEALNQEQMQAGAPPKQTCARWMASASGNRYSFSDAAFCNESEDGMPKTICEFVLALQSLRRVAFLYRRRERAIVAMESLQPGDIPEARCPSRTSTSTCCEGSSAAPRCPSSSTTPSAWRATCCFAMAPPLPSAGISASVNL